MLDRVTITGADDGVHFDSLCKIADKYPFVEWGILISLNKMGTPRYPSRKWLSHFVELDVRTSIHVCGRIVRDIVFKGAESVEDELDFLDGAYDRVQLNASPYWDRSHNEFFDALKGSSQFIFQMKEFDSRLIDKARDRGIDAVPLFDRSGGKGLSPDEWPRPLKGVFCGYAGGLSPENLPGQIESILEVSGDAKIWVDMESGVRADNCLDLSKVEKCLEIAAPFVLG